MNLDFSKCAFLHPTGERLREVYRVLRQIFPTDGAVYDEMLDSGKPFYTLSPYALYQREEFVGHVGIIPMRVWAGGNTVEIVGVGAVATAPRFRRMGVAKFLLTCCTRAIDERGSVSALFTDLPEAYSAHGFEVVPQKYCACTIASPVWRKGGCEIRILDTLDQQQTAQMATIYANHYPNYEGKLVRDRPYWDVYQMLFNPYPKSRIVFAHRRGRLRGYARFDRDTDRLTVTELCCDPEAAGVAESLFRSVWDCAMEAGLALCTFALPPRHFAWKTLRQKGIRVGAEPGGVRRESFMLRPVPRKPLGTLGGLPWSLADKF